MAPYLGTNGDSDASGTSSPQLNAQPAPAVNYGPSHGLEQEANIPIAICGMGLRISGGVETPAQFWDFLVNKGDARQKVPKTRYDVDAYWSASRRPGTVTSKYGYFLDDKVPLSAFDSSRFNPGRAELEFMDPQQRRMLEVVREAFDDAGEVSFRGKDIGCYVGSFNDDWLEMSNKDNLRPGPYRIEGTSDFIIPNRISYEYDLKGPSFIIRTACSSSLVGLHEACVAIQRGHCSGAIVGGVNMILAPALTEKMSEKGILSPEGSCKSFSADADGYARGEAVTAIYIKPLDAAIRDGNPVRAVIRAAMANADGKSNGITQPNGYAHEEMIRKAYALAGISDFHKTAYFECHGTGTAVGDPIETNAVARIFGDEGIHITSVKPNVGHTEAASGLVSLIKAVLSLENATIPPNIKFNIPNPNIPFKERKLTVPTEPTPFPADRAERVSVNSFGIGGANAHVILDSAKEWNVPVRNREVEPVADSQLLLFSAATAPSLKNMVANMEEFLKTRPDMADKLEDVAYTLANRREHLGHRGFKVVGKAEAPASAGRKIPNKALNLVMVFTGQGAQWPRMGRELLLREDLSFGKTMAKLDKFLQTLASPPAWSIEKELNKPAKTSGVQRAELSQPLCTAIQIGLVDMFTELGIQPKAVVGHSSGELAAAYAAGALTAEEAIIGAYQRGQAAKLQSRKGGMAAVGLGWEEVEPFLEAPKVVIACENSPRSVTISGDVDAVQAAVDRIKEAKPDVTARLLKVEKAYHSYHMREIGEDYNASIRDHLSGKAPTKPFYSSVSGTGHPEERPLNAKYWQQNLESPVLFSGAVAGILRDIENPVFLEVGPHGALAGPARQIFAKASASPQYLAAMSRSQDCVETFLTAVGQLYELNVPMDFKALTPVGETLTDLPTYPWNYEGGEYWSESRISKEWRTPQFPLHPLLGQRSRESTSFEPSFRNILYLSDITWLRDHCIDGNVIFPCAGYMAMVGEGIRQMSGAEASYRIRHMVLSAAFVLKEGVYHEVVTTFKPHRLTDNSNSQWYDFTIASHNGQMWTKHCSGQVGPGPAEAAYAKGAAPLPRKLERKKIYDTLNKAGMEYGPQFQRLDDIRAGTIDRTASSVLTRELCGDEAFYHMHPAVIDAALQSGLVAAQSGLLTPANCKGMPTLLEDVTVFRTDPDTELRVTAVTEQASGSNKMVGLFQAIADGKVMLDMAKTQITQLSADGIENKNHLPITGRLTWRPHADFLNIAKLVKPEIARETYTPILEEIAHLATSHIQRHIESAESFADTPAMQNFVTWVGNHAQKVGPSSLDDAATLNMITALVGKTTDTPVHGSATALLKIVQNIDTLLNGETDALELLVADDTLASVFASSDAVNTTEFIKAVSHTKANLRVLEIGAGAGGATARFLKDLTLPNGHALFSKYTYTEVTSEPFVDAKKRFAETKNIDFKVLDISKDPADQGFGEEKYDLVIAGNVLHATKSLKESLINVRKLVAPGGRFLQHELHTESKWVNLVFGLLGSWWNGAEDGRAEEPYVTPARWESEFKAAGFELDAVVLDGAKPHQLNATFITKPEPAEIKPINKAISIWYDEESKNVEALSEKLQGRGYTVDKVRLGSDLPTDQDVISLLDDKKPFFEGITEANWKNFQNALDNLGEKALFWITKLAQVNCVEPRYAQVIGAARTVRNETLREFATCEVDDFNSSLEKILDVFSHFQHRSEGETVKPDYEYAIINNTVSVGRVLPFVLQDEPTAAVGSNERLALALPESNQLAKLQWIGQSTKDLVADQVEIEVHAAGLNFKDATAVVKDAFPQCGLGLDASGIITRVGPAVTDLRVGDRVTGLGAGAFASHLVTGEKLVEKIPNSLSFEEAATLPVAFATAFAALHEIGNLQRSQSVLIHSAAGGVGQAAVQLAKMTGSKIFATVGSDDKIKFLTEKFGIPRNHIFSSRDTSFVEGILSETNGEGVDLALNSLSGELLHGTWKVVAEFGKLVEIGNSDAAGAGKLDLDSFLGSRTYTSVNLSAYMAKRPAIVKELLRSTVRLHKQGHVTPINQVIYDASSVQDAFKMMQEGTHLGKVVLSMRDSEGSLKIDSSAIKSTAARFQLDGTASYLLVGGLGGIGRSLSRHLIEHGARRLVFLSRSAGSGPDDADTVTELQSMGCEVRLVKGSVVKKEDVARAVSQAPNLKGILQCSMVLRDESFWKMSIDDWNTATDPKVKGTWNLHEVTEEAGIKLDFLVMLASISGALGQPGQANYSGANTFLDAFAQYRNNLGLAAASIDIGAVRDIGVLLGNEALLQRLVVGGSSGVTEGELLEALTTGMASSPQAAADSTVGESFSYRNQFTVGIGSTVSLASPDSRAPWKKDIRMSAYQNISEAAGGSDDAGASGLKSFLAANKKDADVLRKPETVTYFAMEIGKQLLSFLLKSEDDLNVSTPLSQLGLDSLAAIELRNWWRQFFGFDVTVLELLGLGTLEGLGKHASEGLLKALE